MPCSNAALKVSFLAAYSEGILPGPIPIVANLANSVGAGGFGELFSIHLLISSYTLIPDLGINEA